MRLNVSRKAVTCWRPVGRDILRITFTSGGIGRSIGVQRRSFLQHLAGGTLGFWCGTLRAMALTAVGVNRQPASEEGLVTLFLSGDVMTGRGIDQVLPHPCPPRLHESYVTSALQYVEMAVQANGPIPRPVAFDYIWGEALAELDRVAPDLRVVNLETAVTTSEDQWPEKGIHYRMHPDNIPCLTAAGIDCCVLANNHVIDWGYSGLLETLQSLERAGLATAGAGRNQKTAEAPAVFTLPGKGRVLVFAFGHASSGVSDEWQASVDAPGLSVLPDLSEATVAEVRARIAIAARRPGDLVVASIHWGGNWGYEVPRAHRTFARRLIEEAGVHLVHGHSSHHPRGIEVHKGRLILYGCGDFLNDYEGISGYEAFRDDLALMYFVTLDPHKGQLVRLDMTPLQIKRFRLQHPSDPDRRWMRDTLNRAYAYFGTRLEEGEDGRFRLAWRQDGD